MTNWIAFWLAVVITTAICLDLAFGWGGVPFLLRKFLALLTWVHFWR